jgi:hypothetical protein
MLAWNLRGRVAPEIYDLSLDERRPVTQDDLDAIVARRDAFFLFLRLIEIARPRPAEMSEAYLGRLREMLKKLEIAP